MLSEHPNYKFAKEKILQWKFQKGVNASWVVAFPGNASLDSVLSYTGQGCHAYFSNPNKAGCLFGVGFMAPQDQQPQAEKFLEWILSDISPWRMITHNKAEIEVIRKKDELLGILIGTEVTDTVRFEFIKNFAIACRFPNEQFERLNHWYTLVTEFDVHPADAFYLGRWFYVEKGDFVLTYSNHDGTHWALSDPVDWSAFRYGNVTLAPPKHPSGLNVYLQKMTSPRMDKNTLSAGMTGDHVRPKRAPIKDVLQKYYEMKKVLNLE